jgi:hypothetical protein
MAKENLHERFQQLAGIKSLNENENPAYELDKRDVENLKYLTKFRGDEKIEELTGLANYILDNENPRIIKK